MMCHRLLGLLGSNQSKALPEGKLTCLHIHKHSHSFVLSEINGSILDANKYPLAEVCGQQQHLCAHSNEDWFSFVPQIWS